MTYEFDITDTDANTRIRKQRWNTTNRGRKQRWEGEHRPPKSSKPFAGFDGEGWEYSGKHELFVLRAGSSELYTGKPLLTWDVFSWLVELPRDSCYVGYALGYDLTMILRGLPRERFLRLHNREQRKNMPVDYAIFRLDWIPGKRFSVWLRDEPKKRFDVEDVVGCFQQSFAVATEAWKVTSLKDQQFIETMKAERSGFARLSMEPGGVEKIRRYNELECVLLARMMERVREACRVQEIRPTSWYGAGQLAQALLRKNRAKDCMESFKGSRFFSHADSAYYGGYFDTSEVGVFPEMYEYDIASAYPHAMRSLPCLHHARLAEHSQGGRDRVLYRVSWKPVGSPEWGAFPVRHRRNEKMLTFDIPPHTFLEGLAVPTFTPGTLYYPTHGQGWYWDAEVEAVRRRGEYEISILDQWCLQCQCDCEPFKWVPELYDYRKRLGKSGQGMVLKLGMNSLYGKLAQHVGKPQFASVVWAGMITSQTRGMIHDAIRVAGSDNVVMVATDAVYSKRPIEGVSLGESLGDWEAKTFGEYLVIVPGLHYSGDEAKIKTRGIPARIIRENISRIKDVWYSSHRWDNITFGVETFISCQAAYHVGKGELRGEWRVLPRSIHFGSADKRELPLTNLEGDSVRLPLWPNTRRLASGHRTEWDYAQALRARRERECGLPEWESVADSQPDYVDPLAFG